MASESEDEKPLIFRNLNNSITKMFKISDFLFFFILFFDSIKNLICYDQQINGNGIES